MEQEWLNYFKSNKGFTRVLEKMRDKYISLGHIGGTVILHHPTVVEKEALSGLLKKDFSKNKSISITLENFQKSLDQTRFSGIQLSALLKAYFSDALDSKKVLRESFEEERNRFFRERIEKFDGTLGGKWLETVWQQKINAYNTLVQRYESRRAELVITLDFVCQAINQLPYIQNEKKRLPVFASSITKNPHYFDCDTLSGQLLIYALAYIFNVEKPVNAEARAELYYMAGILYDEVSNHVLCVGLRGFSEMSLHPGWEGFYRSNEPMMVTLSNLSRLEKVTSPRRMVFIVENPAVFAAIKDRLGDSKASMICTYGQIKIAALVLLDLLASENTQMFYSGDFDPEGLLIADKLSQRYGEKLVLWRYTIEDYEKAKSDSKINNMRIKKLDKLQNESLRILSVSIKNEAHAGYQELLIQALIQDICDKQEQIK